MFWTENVKTCKSPVSTVFHTVVTLSIKLAVVAEWSKALSQIQVERMPWVPGLNTRSGLRKLTMDLFFTSTNQFFGLHTVMIPTP